MKEMSGVYWSGPYDGSPLFYQAVPGTVHRLPVVPLALDGRTVHAPLGSYECYRWCVSHRRYEWAGTVRAKVDA